MLTSSIVAPVVIALGISLVAGLLLPVLGLFVKPKERAAAQVREPDGKVAAVGCKGIYKKNPEEIRLYSFDSCRVAKELYGGPRICKNGCIGLGDCAKVCPKGAIEICEGLAKIDERKCDGCGKCKDVCPQSLIYLDLPGAPKAVSCGMNCPG